MQITLCDFCKKEIKGTMTRLSIQKEVYRMGDGDYGITNVNDILNNVELCPDCGNIIYRYIKERIKE